MKEYLIAMGLGATLSFFLDPNSGRQRRDMARDRTIALVRRSIDRFDRMRRRIVADLHTKKQPRLTRSVMREATKRHDEIIGELVESERSTRPAA